MSDKQKIKKISYHIIFISLLFLIFFNSCTTAKISEKGKVAISKNTKKLLDEDVEYLKQILTQCYIAYDDIVEKNDFDVDATMAQIIKYYPNYVKNYSEKGKAKTVYKNGIDEWAFGSSIAYFLRQNMKINDSHFAVIGDSINYRICDYNCAAFSDLYFEKVADDFIVYSSPIGDIKKGQKFTGDVENLRVSFKKGDEKELYRYIPFVKDFEKLFTSVFIDGEEKQVPIHSAKRWENQKGWIGYQETADSIYVSLGECLFFPNDKEKEKEVYKKFEEICKKIVESEDNKKNVIIDLRNNHGGYVDYPKLILSALYCANANAVNSHSMFESVIDLSSYGEIELFSLMILENRIQSIKENETFSLSAELEDNYKIMKRNPKRYYGGLEKPALSYRPKLDNTKYMGKVIILMNKGSASASELGIAYSYLSENENIILVGENTSGCIEYGDRRDYVLPNSGIMITACSISFKKCAYLAQNPNWHGETYGFYPDYWADEKNLLETLKNLTGDEELSLVLKDLPNRQL